VVAGFLPRDLACVRLQRSEIRRMLDGIRERARNVFSRSGAQPQRRVTRREREDRQKRLLYIATGIAGAVVIIALVVGASYQYYFYPRSAVATVNGTKIERRDYWMVRGLQLRQNLAQLNQQYQMTQPDQRPQLEQQAQTITDELKDVRGAALAEDTISAMVDNVIVLQHMGEFGIQITQAEMDEFTAAQFAPGPLSSPTPTPPVDATAAAWATGTSEAKAAEATQTMQAMETAAAAASPTGEITGTPEATGTVATSPTSEATTTAPAVVETGTPATDGTPSGSPVIPPSPTPSPTIAADAARATAVSRIDQYTTNFLKPSGMTRADYDRLIVRPELAKSKVREQLEGKVPQRADQIHAAHILVATEDAAKAVEDRLAKGEDFAAVAKEVSTDTQTAGNGGDLGWFPRGVMVAPFEAAAFALKPDEVSAPVQSTFGWHVIKVFEVEQDRPLTLDMVQSLKVRAYNDWVQKQRDASEITSAVPLTTLQRQQNQSSNSTFQAPADAPQPPPPTLAPASPAP